MSAEQRKHLADMLARPADTGSLSIDEMRAAFAETMDTFPVPAQVQATSTIIAGRRAIVVEPEQPAGPGTILYFHGGSFMLGSPETAMALTANLVVRTGFRAISLDYRLAPEHPYPAGINDAVAAYRALLDNGGDPQSIAFAGDSAGGGIAVGACLLERDAGLPLPAAVLTFSALLDATGTGTSMTTKKDVDPFLTREGLASSGEAYLAGQDPREPLLSPAVYADMTGFPPLLLQVGTNELLLDDSTRLAQRALDAGVDVTLDVTADVPHVFQAFVGALDEAGEALDRAALFLTQRLTPR